MPDALHQELFIAPKRSFGVKLVAGLSALALTGALFVGYTYLRRRHSGNVGAAQSAAQSRVQPKKPPQALILVDDALLHGNKTIVGGTVKNTSAEKLSHVAVELELKRRKDALTETKMISLEPAQLEPGQEGRYSLELKNQEYGSARLVGLRVGPDSNSVAFTSGSGQKRPPERLESKTVVVSRPSSKRSEFLNSPDNPARVP